MRSFALVIPDFVPLLAVRIWSKYESFSLFFSCFLHFMFVVHWKFIGITPSSVLGGYFQVTLGEYMVPRIEFRSSILQACTLAL